MKLNVAERIALLPVLPKEGDFTTLKILRELQEKIGFSEDDFKKFKLVTKVTDAGSRIEWDPKEGAKEVGIELGEKALEIVKEALLSLDKSKKLKPEQMTLYEKFVQEKEDKK